MWQGPKHHLRCDDRTLEAPNISIDMWIMIDKVKSENRGWFVLEAPMVEELRKLVSQGLFKALEADECPVRFNYQGRIMAWGSGLKS
jgi:hypothetical protein